MAGVKSCNTTLGGKGKAKSFARKSLSSRGEQCDTQLSLRNVYLTAGTYGSSLARRTCISSVKLRLKKCGLRSAAFFRPRISSLQIQGVCFSLPTTMAHVASQRSLYKNAAYPCETCVLHRSVDVSTITHASHVRLNQTRENSG